MGEMDSPRWAVASGLFMGTAILTKYPTGFIIPLTLVWTFLRWRKLKTKWLGVIAWAIGISFLIAYSLWTSHLYGQPHILAASARMVQVYGWSKIFVFLVFFSGSFLVPLLGWPYTRWSVNVVAAAVFAGCVVFFSSAYGGFTVLQSILLGLWSVTTIVFLVAFASAYKKWESPKDPFLLIWMLGFVAMMLLVMGWVAVRYYVIAAPAVVWSLVRLIEINHKDHAQRRLLAVLSCTIFFSGLLAYADYKQADPSRRLAGQLEKAGFSGGERHFYLGDSFTMAYLKRTGWVPCFPETELKAGDWVLAKQVTMPQAWFYKKPLLLKELAQFNYPTSFPIKVMDNQGSAGFYASVWGALPFTISNSPWESFHLFEVVEVRE